MPAKRLTMRKIREVLRLKFECGFKNRKVAKSCNVSRSTVSEYLRRFEQSALTWPLSPEIDDQRLEQLMFPPAPSRTQPIPMPQWASIHKELRRKGVTLMLLWEEYKAVYPKGYQYSQFCYHYQQWKKHIDPSMRLDHRAGETMFVDYAGMTVEVHDPVSGDTHPAQIFVATLAASSYTYAEATKTQGLPEWIASHVRAFQFFDGITEVLVPDNLKSGVNRPCLYEPEINATYLEMARSYKSVQSILKNGLDRATPAQAVDQPVIVHRNIRGSRYYQ